MRLFPRTARRRMAAAARRSHGAGLCPARSRRRPQGQAEAGRERDQGRPRGPRRVQRRSCARRRRASQAAQEQLGAREDPARHGPRQGRGRRERDAEMQAELVAGRGRARRGARRSSRRARPTATPARRRSPDTVTAIYEEGDPELMAFSSLLDAGLRRGPHPPRRRRDVDRRPGGRAYDELKAAEVLLEVREDQVARPRDEVAVKREAAAEHLALMQALEAEAAGGQGLRRRARGRAPRRRAARPARHARGPRQAAQAREAAAADQGDAPQARARRPAPPARAGARHARSSPPAPTHRPAGLPGRRATSPRRSATGPTRSTTTGASTTAPTSAAAAAPRCAPRRPARSSSSYFSGVYGNRLFIDLGVLDGKGIATIYNHASGYTVGVGHQVQRGPGHRLRR